MVGMKISQAMTKQLDAGIEVERLEVHYLANPEGHLHFALLSDWADAPRERMPGDARALPADARANRDRLSTSRDEERGALFADVSRDGGNGMPESADPDVVDGDSGDVDVCACGREDCGQRGEHESAAAAAVDDARFVPPAGRNQTDMVRAWGGEPCGRCGSTGYLPNGGECTCDARPF